MIRSTLAAILISLCSGILPAVAKILIPMDLAQTDHLKAYGVAYHALARGENVEWLLNYRGGSFFLEDSDASEQNCLVAGVTYEKIGGAAASAIYDQIENANMDVVLSCPHLCRDPL